MNSHEANSHKQEPAIAGKAQIQSASEAKAAEMSRSLSMLVGIEPCLEIVFPDAATRPGKRTFLEWKARKYFPSVKIGKRVFLDPVAVRKALEKRFTIEAID
jgi:hypothetical protein